MKIVRKTGVFFKNFIQAGFIFGLIAGIGISFFSRESAVKTFYHVGIIAGSIIGIAAIFRIKILFNTKFWIAYGVISGIIFSFKNIEFGILYGIAISLLSNIKLANIKRLLKIGEGIAISLLSSIKSLLEIRKLL